MPRFPAFLLLLTCCATLASAQPAADPSRSEALAALSSDDDGQRAQAIAWIAQNGRPGDAELLVQRLTDESPVVRDVAERGLWVLWSHSGDAAVDALLARGVDEMEAGRLDKSIATFSEVIRRKPGFAEGWNKRATALFLSREFRRSLADCDEVMKRNPYHFGALAGYGQIYFNLRQYDKAIAYWRRALRVNPNMQGVEEGIEGAEKLLAEQRKNSV
jgi:tetratricopeptide (TPR) repeat protein